jgi:lipoate-protein ligase A
LPLTGDITRLIDLLALSEVERSALRTQLAARAGTLAQALGVPEDSALVQFEEVAEALTKGFAQTLHLSFQRRPLSAAETQGAARLIREQYGNLAWTQSY